MSSPFPKKSIYHSQLVKECPIEVTITGAGPQASKFKGHPDFVACKIDGDEHFILVENDNCAEILTGLRGETVTLTASGRGADAEISVEPSVRRGREDREDREEPPPRREERREREPERQREEPRGRETLELAEFRKAKVLSGRAAVLLEICLLHAVRLNDQYLHDKSGPPNSEDIRALAVTLFIDTTRRVNIENLPTKFIPKEKPLPKEKPPERRQEQRREEPPPREPDPDLDAASDDIPF
jgi:hypothetical protein